MVTVSGLRRIIRVLATDSAVAVIPPVMALVFIRELSFREALKIFQFSLVYSHVIGAMAHFLIPRVWMRFPNVAAPVHALLRAFYLLVLAIVGTLICGVIFIGLGWDSRADFWLQFSGAVKISIVITIVVGGILSLYESLRVRLDETALELRTRELERERAVKLAAEARLSSLESRIHPHFLFNAINSISCLIADDPKRAEHLLGRMAALLRFSLDSGDGGLAPLHREMEIVAGYLDIEKARFGDRLRFELDVPAELREILVPRLSVQTLVENSIKYAVAPSRAGGSIRVSARKAGDGIRIEIVDDGPGFTQDEVPAGHGIDNLQSRLTAQFGVQASLQIQRNSVALVVPAA